MQKVICEILLDNIAFISTTNYELIDAMRAIDLEDVP
jgi:hypothetical protein